MFAATFLLLIARLMLCCWPFPFTLLHTTTTIRITTTSAAAPTAPTTEDEEERSIRLFQKEILIHYVLPFHFPYFFYFVFYARVWLSLLNALKKKLIIILCILVA